MGVLQVSTLERERKSESEECRRKWIDGVLVGCYGWFLMIFLK